MADLVQQGRQQFLDMNGDPLASGFVYFYAPGTSTPKTTWVEPTGSVMNTNPVVLDQAGRAVIWGEGEYRQVVTDQFGNIQWDTVTIAGFNGVINGPLTVNGAVTVNGNSNFNGTTTFNGNTGTIGNDQVSGNLIVGGTTNLHDLNVTAGATINGGAVIAGGGSWAGTPIFTNGLNLPNDVCISWQAPGSGAHECMIFLDSSNTLNIGGNAGEVLFTATNGLFVENGGVSVQTGNGASSNFNDTTVHGNLDVTGGANITGNETVGGNLTVAGTINGITIGGGGGGGGPNQFGTRFFNDASVIGGSVGSPAVPSPSPSGTVVTLGSNDFYLVWQPIVDVTANNNYAVTVQLPTSPANGFTIWFRLFENQGPNDNTATMDILPGGGGQIDGNSRFRAGANTQPADGSTPWSFADGLVVHTGSNQWYSYVSRSTL